MTEQHSRSFVSESISALSSFKNSLLLLFKSNRSLLYMYIINYLMSFQYYILVTLIPLYFTSEHSFSDIGSGVIFGLFGIIIGVFSIYLSSIMHVISLKKGLGLSSILGILGFSMMITGNMYISVVSVLSLLAVSSALSWPFLEYGIKIFSSDETRNLSSSFYYITNYLAGITAGLFIDLSWLATPNKSAVYALIFSMGILNLMIAVILVVLSQTVQNCEKEELSSEEAVSSQKKLWRYCGLVFLLTLLRSACFGHLDATLPKYMLAVFGENAHFGVMLAIHSVTMIVGVFSLTTLTYSYSSYSLIIVGAAIGSLGSRLLIFSIELWAIVLFVIAISIGESIWVPRLLDYTYSIAPKGQEGIYLAISNCPFYFGMILTGITSGTLLKLFCPNTEVQETNANEKCYMIWEFVFLGSIWIPAALFAFRNRLEEQISYDQYMQEPKEDPGFSNDLFQNDSLS